MEIHTKLNNFQNSFGEFVSRKHHLDYEVYLKLDPDILVGEWKTSKQFRNFSGSGLG